MNKGFLYKCLFILPFVGHFLINGNAAAKNNQVKKELVQACVPVFDRALTLDERTAFARCLERQPEPQWPICYGKYKSSKVQALANTDEIHIMADEVSFYTDKRSQLKGRVEVQQNERVVSADTAYVYRNLKNNTVDKIELIGNVRYKEATRLMVAEKATINPQNKLGDIENVLYRLDIGKHGAMLPAWGRAAVIKRVTETDYLLNKASYSNCAPQDNSWEIQARQITIDQKNAKAVARDAVFKIRDYPVFYTPYISFPTDNNRKSGFLMPYAGYTNVGGYELALPYYLNLAPNYDATFKPHYYSKRGLMLGGEFRYINPYSSAVVQADFLPHDKAFSDYIETWGPDNPSLQGLSSNRWSVAAIGSAGLRSNLTAHVDYHQVSDDYYFQDFSTNLASVTSRQLLRQGDVTYSSDHWIVSGMVQSYQTLNPINLTPVADAYERLPQIKTRGYYEQLPLNAVFMLDGQYDQFHWPTNSLALLNGQYNQSNLPVSGQKLPWGPRLFLNPALSFPHLMPWGFITPAIDLVARYYEVENKNWSTIQENRHFDLLIPRYSLNGGLFFDRNLKVANTRFTQTLEPRLFYLYVPYRDQTPIPVYDSGYLIFNSDQLFRVNRFSGYDRTGDANQLSYALTSRFISEQSGEELINLSVGQIRYFSERKVQLCQSADGFCVDNPDALGYLSPTYDYSPLVGSATYHLNQQWRVTGQYVWDPATAKTNNGYMNFHYQPEPNKLINFGYTFLVNADTSLVRSGIEQSNNLHQLSFSYAWPFTDHWSSLGAYSYNISKGYNMLTFVGIQYDTCCWALRLMGGQTYKNLNEFEQPIYNNNVYLQILFKGLGSVSSSDPYETINTYIPGYQDQFHH